MPGNGCKIKFLLYCLRRVDEAAEFRLPFSCLRGVKLMGNSSAHGEHNFIYLDICLK